MKTSNINVRLEDDVYNQVTEIAEQFKRSRSEIVRLAISNELDKFSSQRSYTKEEYTNIINVLKDLSNSINTLETQLIKIGVNINQLAKYTHKVGDDRYITENKGYLISCTNELDKINDTLSKMGRDAWGLL